MSQNSKDQVLLELEEVLKKSEFNRLMSEERQ